MPKHFPLPLLFICVASSASDNDGDTTESLVHDTITEHIIVSASRTNEDEFSVPYNVTIVSQDRITQTNRRTIIDALADIPGVLLQKTGVGQGSPYLRGFTGYRNIMLIDGIRLNNSAFREGPNQYWNTIDHLSLESIEVIKGTTSTLYGSDAIGGVVNVRSGVNKTTDITQSYTKLFYRYGAAEHSHTGRAEFNWRGDTSFVSRVGLSHKDYGNFDTPMGTAQDTAYNESNADLQAVLDLSPTSRFKLSHSRTQQNDVPRTHKTIYAQSFAGTTVGNELRRDLFQDRTLTYLRYTQDDFGNNSNLNVTLSRHEQSERRERLRTNNRFDEQGFNVTTIGLNLVGQVPLADKTITLGYDGYFDSVDSFSSSNAIQGPVADNASYDWQGIFTQINVPMTERLTLHGGLRFSLMSVDSDAVASPTDNQVLSVHDDWRKLSGNIRVAYSPDTLNSQWFAGVSQGFRAPNLSDLTRFDSARSNEFEIPALDLAPENYLTVETGYKLRENNFSADFTIYHTRIKDLIQRFPTGNQNADGEFEISKDNIGDGYARGIEGAFRIMLSDQWQVSANLAYMQGEASTYPTSAPVLKDEPLSRLMPTNAHLELTYRSPAANWWLALSTTAFARADRLSTRDREDTQRIPPGGTPGYVVWDVFGGLSINPNTDINIGLFNLFDKNYRVHGSGQNEVGRNLTLSISLQF